MDGTQTPGINFNSIDGLTTVSATSISINGSTINLGNYIPYVGAVSNPDFNTKILRNIGNAVNPQDAVALSQLGSYIPYTGAVSNPDFNTRRLTNIGDALAVNDAVSLQQLNAYQPNTITNGAGTVYAACGLTNLTLQADATGFINIGSVIDCSGNKIINLSNPTNLQDAVNLQTLNAFRPSSIINGITSVVCDGTNVTNNIGNSSWIHSDSALTLFDSASVRYFTIGWPSLSNDLSFSNVAGTGKFIFNGEVDVNSNKIINLANGTASGDAVNFGQLSTISSLITPLPAGSIQGSYIVYNGTSYVNNTDPVYLGSSPGKTGSGSINIGSLAGLFSSTAERIAMGTTAGYDSQATNCIAIGRGAGNNGQLESAIAIGYGAGRSVQGRNSIAIGLEAGYTNQHASTIIINGTGSTLNSAVAAATYVAPIRQVPTAESDPRQLMYKLDTKEIIYNQTIIFNVTIIGQATADPNATVPLVYFAPTGVKPSFGGFTCTVARAAQGRYTLTFPAGSNPNFGTFTTITTGVNSEITTPVGGSKIVTARYTTSNTVDICYVNADAAFTDLQLAERISLRIEF